jgi:hypothetical protein
MRSDKFERLHVILMAIDEMAKADEKITADTVHKKVEHVYKSKDRILMAMSELTQLGAVEWEEIPSPGRSRRVKAIHLEKLFMSQNYSKSTTQRLYAKALNSPFYRIKNGELFLDGEMAFDLIALRFAEFLKSEAAKRLSEKLGKDVNEVLNPAEIVQYLDGISFESFSDKD